MGQCVTYTHDLCITLALGLDKKNLYFQHEYVSEQYRLCHSLSDFYFYSFYLVEYVVQSYFTLLTSIYS